MHNFLSRHARRPRTSHLITSAVAVAALAMLTACSENDDTADSARSSAGGTPPTTPTPTAPLTPAQAQAVVARYVKINNAANALAYSDPTKATSLNAQIEANPLQAQSLAQYKKLKIATAKDRADYRKPFYYTNTRFYIPTNSVPGQAPFFFAVSHEGKNQGLLVFVQGSDKIWKNAAAVWPDGPLPAISLDAQGNATALAPDASGLAMRPTLLPTAVNDNYSTGGKADGSALAVNKVSTRQRAAIPGWNKDLRPYARVEASPANDPYQAVWALRTKDGGALVVASRIFDEHFIGLPQPGGGNGYINIPPHDDARAWVGSQSPYLTKTFTCLDAAVIPKAGKTSQIGEDCEVTNAT